VLYTVYPMFNYAYYDYVGNAQMASEWGHPTSYSANAIDFIFDRRLVP
jgi:hypothetical protein